MTATRSFSFGDIWESVSAAVPERDALVVGTTRLSYRDLAGRAAGLAGWLDARGVSAGTRVGVMMRNSAEHVQMLLACFYLSATPVNVNYRLRPDDLAYLARDADMAGLIVDPDLQDLAREGLSTLQGPVWVLTTGDAFDEATRVQPPPRPSRSGDDEYLLYTGGTTGRPKGVLWRMEDAYFSCLGGGDPSGAYGPVTSPAQVLDRLAPEGHAFLPVAPLIHAAGTWTLLRWLFAGSKIVLEREFAAANIWDDVESENVRVMNIVGDAMARPLLEALADRDVSRLGSLETIATGGAGISPTTIASLLQILPQLTIKDSYGSSETGVHGWIEHRLGGPAAGAQPFRTRDTILLDPDTKVPLQPGDRVGLVARRGRVPLCYWNDPIKSASTFIEIAGERVAVTGDQGRFDSDGMLVLLGRGSQCINTGGEKVFAEEVELALRSHTDVTDSAVVGVDDTRWGKRVVGLVSLTPGSELDPDLLRTHCRSVLASFKVPKQVLVVREIRRGPTGKVDYRWAETYASDNVSEAEALS